MSDSKMTAQMSAKPGFIAALDQSGGSTPKALRDYGITEDSYSGDAEMFKLMHEMRVRIISAPAFTGEKVIGVILFEQTMDGQAHGKPVPTFLWQDRGIPDVPDLYAGLIAHPKVERVVALSGGYARDEACKRLKTNHDMIASFSRALVEGLSKSMSDADFDSKLGRAVDEIYEASTVKA